MRITLHVYRTHDHDLMALHQTGALSIGQATKKAVIAYYKGEPLCISTKTDRKPDISLMPLTTTFSFVVSESDAEGITDWIRDIRLGYRNCYFKNVLRHYLDDPATYLFREDEWQVAAPKDALNTDSIVIPAVLPKRTRNELVGSEWVEAVAKEKKRKYTNKKISDLDDLLGQPNPPKEQVPSKESPSLHEAEEEKADEFDAYAAFLELRNGE